jgi:hypothetical protein
MAVKRHGGEMVGSEMPPNLELVNNFLPKVRKLYNKDMDLG